MDAVYYDHAKNQTNAAIGHAIARCAREAKEEGSALRIEANWPSKPRFFWIGCACDVRSLERELRWNRAENVVVTRVER